MTEQEILDDFPDLAPEDIKACFAFAANRKRKPAPYRRETLFDENLSHKLADTLADVFPDSEHVRDVGLSAVQETLTCDAPGYSQTRQKSQTEREAGLFVEPPPEAR